MTSPAEPPEVAPDDKDWTFVITQGCADCGFDPTYEVPSTGSRLRAVVPRYDAALKRPDVTERPAPTVWSILEYSCHVRDVCQVFGERLRQMLAEDDPLFANWDQDRAAIEGRYWAQQPDRVAHELADFASVTADAFDAVTDDQWPRTGRRSNGSVFTVATLAVYFLHDVEHHLHDIGS